MFHVRMRTKSTMEEISALMFTFLLISTLYSLTYAREGECSGKMSFSCGDGKCISPDWLCDRHDDCYNGRDEENCTNICKPEEFQCDSETCIPLKWTCDSETDCPRGEDEMDCEKSEDQNCQHNEFSCGDSYCISKDWVCDGEPDCHNGMDEKSCNNSDDVIETTEVPRVTTSNQTDTENATFPLIDQTIDLNRDHDRRRQNQRNNGKNNGSNKIDREERRKQRKEKKRKMAEESQNNESDQSGSIVDQGSSDQPVKKDQYSTASTRHKQNIFQGAFTWCLLFVLLCNLIGIC